MKKKKEKKKKRKEKKKRFEGNYSENIRRQRGFLKQVKNFQSSWIQFCCTIAKLHAFVYCVTKTYVGKLFNRRCLDVNAEY